MSIENVNNLPEGARLWIYGFEAALDDASRRLISQRLDAFIEGWTTHGAPVDGAWGFLEDRFVFVSGHNPEGVSGCSIDSSVANFKWLKEKHGLDGLNRTLVFFKDRSGKVSACDRRSFQQKVDSGEVTADTVVLDTTLTTVGDLKAGRFETTFAECWHARLFRNRSVKGGTSPG